MRPADIVERARRCSVDLTLNEAGTGLSLWADGDPPDGIVDLIKAHKPEIVAYMRAREAEKAVASSRPPDVRDAQWAIALRGLRAFLAAGHGAEAERLGWPREELYAVPPLWARIDLCGAGLLIGDREVVSITANEIRIRTASGVMTAFNRKPAVDYRLVFETRLKLLRGNYAADSEEPRLRAFDHTVNVCRANGGLDLEAAKTLVAAAIVPREKHP